MRRLFVILGLLLVAMLCSGCFIMSQVEENEVGIELGDGVSISRILNAGRYSNWGWFAELVRIDCSSKTVEWSDPDLWSADKQPLTFKVGVTYQRKRDPEAIKLMWVSYNQEARDDKALERQVLNRIPRVAKAVTTQFTLDQMLGIDRTSTDSGREAVSQRMFDLLEKELGEFGVRLLDVGVNDIGADPAYQAQLKEKAVAKIAVEVAAEKTKQLQEQLKQEVAQTNIELERASRDRQVQEE